ncbi:hypothetical protein [Leucobacter sp. cx-169]|uniref:hypothetical protein n=1 Tax=Leucobacter sp. cx-169 TaxID=2770549 RepID=UPI00165D4875|nr:hypothetical protein [Leucobacter sp. cx-169]MBC9927383.1 hypothetical protein [Leucobacter sp. cx-169]
MKLWLSRLVLAGVAAAMVAVVPAPAFAAADHAAPSSAVVSESVQSIDASASSGMNLAALPSGLVQQEQLSDEQVDELAKNLANSSGLTINRWKGATSGFDSNLGALDTQNASSGASREVLQGFMMQQGNMYWDFAIGVVSFATSVDLVNELLWTVDSAAATFLKVFVGKTGGLNLFGVVTVIAIASVVIGSLKRFRGRELWRRLGSMLVIAAIFALSTMSMLGSNGPLSQPQEGYKSPVGTPGWVVSTITGGVRTLGNLPTAALVSVTSPADAWPSYGDSQHGCGVFLEKLENGEKLRSDFTIDVAGNATAEQRSKIRSSYQSRVVMDRMWQQSGLRTWTNAQFGTGNKFKNDAFCYLLDQRSGQVTPAAARAATPGSLSLVDNVIAEAMGSGPIDTAPKLPIGDVSTKDSALFNPANKADRFGATIGRAACRWGGTAWSVAPGWEGFNNNENRDKSVATELTGKTGGGVAGGLTPENVAESCDAWVTAKSGSDWKKGALAVFHVPGNQAAIRSAAEGAGANSPMVQNFLSSFYGTGAGANSVDTIMYAQLTPIGVAPTIILGLGSLIAQIVLVFSLLMLFVAFAVSLFSAKPWEEKLKPVLMQALTASLFAVGLSVLLGLLMTFSYAISSVGVAMVGSVGFMSTMWVTLSPVMAIIAMTLLWKKAFNTPSPFSLKGFNSWMKGSPLGMAAVAGGAGFLGSKAERMMSGAARGVGRTVSDRVMGGDRVGLGRAGKKSSMTPGGRKGSDLGDTLDSGKTGVPLEAASVRKRAAAEIKVERRQAKIDLRAARAERIAENPGMFRRMGMHVAESNTGIRARNLAYAGPMALDAAARQATKARHAIEGIPGYGRAATTLNSFVGKTQQASSAVSGVARKAASGVHSRVMSNAKEGSTAFGAYSRVAGQGALLGGAALAGPLTLAAAAAGVTVANTKNHVGTNRRERANELAERARQILNTERAKAEAAEEARRAAAKAAEAAAAAAPGGGAPPQPASTKGSSQSGRE